MGHVVVDACCPPTRIFLLIFTNSGFFFVEYFNFEGISEGPLDQHSAQSSANFRQSFTASSSSASYFLVRCLFRVFHC